MFWAVYGLVEVLETKYTHRFDLINRWKDFQNRMVRDSEKVFYDGDGKVRTVSVFDSWYDPVDENHYKSWKS